jgi:hypothetical protein
MKAKFRGLLENPYESLGNRPSLGYLWIFICPHATNSTWAAPGTTTAAASCTSATATATCRATSTRPIHEPKRFIAEQPIHGSLHVVPIQL